MGRIKTFDFQFPGMRKPDNFVVYPPCADMDNPTRYTLQVQGNRTIARFDPMTRKGVLNFKGSNSKYNHHLNKFFGAVDYEFPDEFVKLAMACVALPGDEIGPGVFVGGE